MFPFTQKMPVEKWFGSDYQFNHLYPSSIRPQAIRHWTPLAIAQLAARFLTTGPGVKILDIGSGTGKFCLSAAYFNPHALLYGIEQRKDAIDHANTAKNILGLKNVKFLHGNFTQLQLKDYDHFYFYNSFYENLAGTDKIDDSISYSSSLYNYYNNYLFNRLEQMPVGTRLVTYHSLEYEVPPSYCVAESHADDLLKCWIKI
jgi:SAM-dependent methyltransferase